VKQAFVALVLLLAARTAAAQGFTNVTAESGLEAIRASRVGSYWMSGLLFVDLDGDGDLDFFFGAHHQEGGVASLNDGTGHFTATSTWMPLSEIHVAYDLNEDGRVDVVLTEGDGPGRWWFNTGKPGLLGFGRSSFYDPQARLQMMLDIDRDGKVDWLAAGTGSGVTPGVRVYRGDGNGRVATTADTTRTRSAHAATSPIPRPSPWRRGSSAATAWCSPT